MKILLTFTALCFAFTLGVAFESRNIPRAEINGCVKTVFIIMKVPPMFRDYLKDKAEQACKEAMEAK